MKTSLHLTAQHHGNAAGDGWSTAQRIWQRWRQRVRMRAELHSMDARALADIGMDPEAARRETRKFFWQV